MTPHVLTRRLAWALAVAVLAGLTLLPHPSGPAARAETAGERLTSRPRPAAPAGKPVTVGEVIRTDTAQRRRLLLADGSVVFVNHNTALEVTGDRRLILTAGEVVVDVAPGKDRSPAFVVTTPRASVL